MFLALPDLEGEEVLEVVVWVEDSEVDNSVEEEDDNNNKTKNLLKEVMFKNLKKTQ